MGYARHIAMGLAAAALLAATPAAAQGDLGSAERLRRLDIMLMVTALRCRFGPDNFQPDYEAFSARHLGTLNGAARDLTQALSARYGAQGARRALDRLSTSMANGYGMGHPTMDCGQLKHVTQDLAYATASNDLPAAADLLLADGPQVALF